MIKRVAGILALGLSAAIALEAIGPVLAQEPAGGEIVLAQASQDNSIFRFLRQRQPTRRVIVIERPPEAAPRAKKAQSKKKAVRAKAKKSTAKAKSKARARSTTAKRAKPASAAPATVVAEKSADAARILVVGDFMAGALAKGLSEAYSEKANVTVIDASNGSSGLVRDDHYNWPKEIPGILAEHRPEAIVVLLGSNDRQAIATEAGSQDHGSDGWTKAYAARIRALAEGLKSAGKPIFWGSLVPVRSTTMSRDYSAMNSAFRENLDGTGITFVDLWNGFADAEGQFVASGPDFRGQNAQLRASDGINFTRAGQRKLAFFMQQGLDDLLKADADLPEIASVADPAEASAILPAATTTEPDAPRIGPMVPLDAIRSAEGPLSSTGASGGGSVASVVFERLNGGRGKTPASRADNYLGWPVY